MSGVESDPRSSRPLKPAWQAVIGDHVIALAWSADGKSVVAAEVSGPLTVFASDAGMTAQQLPGHQLGTTTVAWQPNNPARLASAGQDGLIKLWDLKGQPPAFQTLPGGAAWVEHLAWSSGGNFLASGAGKKLRLWDAAGQLKREYPAHSSTIAGLQWKLGEPLLASITYGQLNLWSPEKPEPVHRYEWQGSMLALAWSPDGKYLATGDQDATVHFWILKKGQDLEMAGYQTKVRELSWDHRGRYLATGGGPIVCVWDCSGKGPAGTTPAMLQGHQKPVAALAFQHRSPLLASGGADGLFLLWQPGKSAEPIAWAEFEGGISQLAWSPDDRRVAIGTETGQVAVLSI